MMGLALDRRTIGMRMDIAKALSRHTERTKRECFDLISKWGSVDQVIAAIESGAIRTKEKGGI
mgnify:CR=1 FL=1